jgi:hypothetical protein
MSECSSVSFRADYRLGGLRRIVYCRPEDLMRVSDELLECVCFLCTESPSGQIKVGGTAFFVSYPAETVTDGQFTYLITARHNIKRASESGDALVLRMNTADGGVETANIVNLTWHYPDNPASDVAVSSALGDLREHGFAWRTIPWAMFADQDVIASNSIGVGDELLSTGLFVHHYGKRKNVPIVRSGIIAAMPGEPLTDEDTGDEYVGYLAEIRSIGGLSGSPVFVRLGVGRAIEKTISLGTIQVFLLGLVRGHWRRGQFHAADWGESESDNLNSGIAIVTPITEAMEVIQREDFVAHRKEQEKRHLREHAPTKDSADSSDSEEFDRFETLTRELVNTPKPKPDEEQGQ